MVAHPGDAGGGSGYFEEAYRSGMAPWDIGRPQPVIVELAESGRIGGRVLDIGCGSGENALYLAEKHHDVTGVDGARTAIDRAHAKAIERGLRAHFIAQDFFAAVENGELGGPFDSAIDVGFFHALDDQRRVRFATVLAGLLGAGGLYVMLVFSDRVPGAFGPRRVSEAEIRHTFAGRAWKVLEVRSAPLHSAMSQMPVVDANLALIERA